jgi:hypothetical protein
VALDPTEIPEKIFNHLQMFQFYRDLKKYDTEIRSIFFPHDIDLHDMEVKFLEKWDQKCGRNNIEKWKFENINSCKFCETPDCGTKTLCKHNFIHKFVECEEDIFQNMRVKYF